MSEWLDPVHLFQHLLQRWKVVAIACAAAAALSLTGGFLQPKKYTATARVFIEPPAGSDVRASVAVSPIYLESLRTYQDFAESDSLFLEALDHFKLRQAEPRRAVESWKRAVLGVEIPRNTRVLKISATLGDPVKAQQFAQYLAEKTVALTQSVTRESDEEIVNETARLLADAESALKSSEVAWTDFLRGGDAKQIESEIDSLVTQRYRLLRSLDDARVGLDGTGQASAEARVEKLRSQVDAMQAEIDGKRSLLGRRSALEEKLKAERERARDRHEAMERQYQGLRGALGFRGERLRLIDPGIVPERPTSPNIPLRVIAAVLFAFVASTAFLCLQYGMRVRARASAKQDGSD